MLTNLSRGKPFFRLYEDGGSKEANMTKPRLLFKKKTVSHTPEPVETPAVDDEEAVTDVEDDLEEEKEIVPASPKKKAVTPPRHATPLRHATPPRHVTPEQDQAPPQNLATPKTSKPASKTSATKGPSTSAQKSSLFGSFKFTKQRQTRSTTKRGADEPVDPTPVKRSRV